MKAVSSNDDMMLWFGLIFQFPFYGSQKNDDYVRNMANEILPISGDINSNFWQPLNIEHYDSLLNMAKEIHAYAPDAHILTTYYGGMNSSVLTLYFFAGINT